MPGTFLGLETARRGVQVHQNALEITGHNLTNASTPGYSRQEAVLRVTDPYTNPSFNSVTPGQFGTGVEVNSIRRIRDEYLDFQVRRSTTDAGYWESQISIKQRAEALFPDLVSDPDTEYPVGINHNMTEFFTAWMKVNLETTSEGSKSAVVEYGDKLAVLMNTTYNQLTSIEETVEQPQIDVYANKVTSSTGPDKLTTGGAYTGNTDQTYLVRITGDNGTEATAAEYSTDDGNTWTTVTTVTSGVIDVGSGITIDASSGFDGVGADLTEYQFNVYANYTSGQMSDQVEDINDILVQIRDLTDSIEKVYKLGQQPNDLLDERDRLLEELSSFGQVQVTFGTSQGMPTGELTELTFLGKDVKSAGTKLSLATDGGKILLQVSGGLNNGETVNLTDNSSDISLGGSLLGLEQSRLDLIDHKAILNDIAINLRDKIEAVNNTPPVASCPDFFQGDLVTGTFKVNPALVSNPELIDGDKAGDISNIREVDISNEKPYTFEEYYALLTTEVGGGAKNVFDMATNQAIVGNQITALRNSVSGVNVDEEITKMIQFEYGFQASGRVVSAIDEMLDVIINRLF